MAFINEDRLGARITTWSNGRIVVACAASIALGFVLGAVLF